MSISKKLCSVFLIILMCLGVTGCSVTEDKENQSYKLNIVTSMFPYYDITRSVIGDVKGINLELAVKPGQDSHSFEPTPAEVIKIQEADLFIYNGGEIENWVEEVLESYKNTNQIKVKMMDDANKIELLCSVGHSHDKIQLEDEHMNDEIQLEDEHGHIHDEFDAHIWTSPINAIYITEVIRDILCDAMPNEAENFENNAAEYVSQLKGVDKEIRKIVNNANVKELIFADQFPLIYFTTEYGLEYHAAFKGCGHDMEPSVRDICNLIDEIKEKKIKSVFHLELSSERVADTICEDTGAEKLQFNSCHNVSQKQFDNGVTYISLMQENVENLKKALE